jgi:hypothetical protein
VNSGGVMNKKMCKELEQVNFDEKKIPPELFALLDAGFIALDGCFFIRSLKELCLSVSDTDFLDKTGFECFVNSIHIDDYVDSDYLAIALLFVQACFDVWKNTHSESGKLAGIILSDEIGVVVKFHYLRESESWLGECLERYEEAVFSTDSSVFSLP